MQTTLTLRHLREFWTPQVRAGLRNSVLLGLGTAAVGTALTAVKIPLDAVGNSWYHQLVPGKWF